MAFLLQQKIGIGLVLTSLFGATIVQVTTGDLFHMTSHSDPPVGGPVFFTQITMIHLSVHWQYGVPLAICVVLGFYFLTAPQGPTEPRP